MKVNESLSPSPFFGSDKKIHLTYFKFISKADIPEKNPEHHQMVHALAYGLQGNQGILQNCSIL